MSVLLALATLFFDIEYTFVFFPMFALFLFLYHYNATGIFSKVLLAFLVTAMLSEMIFLYDFDKYINIVSALHITSQLCFLWLLKPILKVDIKEFSTHNLIELIIGTLGISYVVGYLLYLIFPLIPDLTLFVPSVISFLIITILCVRYPFFNIHPDNILLWGIGGGMIAEMTCAFIYQYISDLRVFIVMAHMFGAFLKIIFVIYLIRARNMKTFDKDHL
ncbi:hypothetical protein [uncultured Dokdonia sp.]|uniref:hypothetical protein n=1 Tax=uncultured Dokdonia sp. TaxID=575653 RepID=UPI002612F2FB|nr:hypothetical protein [uncultured Dokdonia sp.]